MTDMTAIELINLTLNEIRRSAQKIADITAEESMVLKHQTDDTVKKILSEDIERNGNALEYCRKSLRDVLEHIAEYQNEWGMTESVDAAIGKVAFDLIYERTTDEDYESKKDD